MRGRPFLAALLALVLAAFGLGLAGWWLVWQRGALHLQHHRLVLPMAARFVPRQAPLSLYLFSDGREPVAYARAVAPPRQRSEAAEAIERLRDGVFAAAGLDYRSELESWLGPEMALALFETAAGEATVAEGSGAPPPVARLEGAPPTGWLLALRSRDEAGARRFLQRFWQSRSLAGTGLQVSRYRGMGLISGRGALVGRDPVPLATALVTDDLVLIGSGRGVLEEALDVSQIDDLNQAGQPRFLQGIERLGAGAALVVARAEAFAPWLGIPTLPVGQGPSPQLMVAVRPEGSALRLEALLGPLALPPAEASPPFRGAAEAEGRLLPELPGSPETLLLVRDPATLLRLPLLQPLLARVAGPPESTGPLPALVAAADRGLLLVTAGPRGWLMGTPVGEPTLEALEPALAADGLLAAPLELEGREATVWTRLEAGDSRGRRQGPEADRLEASVAGWRTEVDDLAWWGRGLALLRERGGSAASRARQRQLEALDSRSAPLRWALGSDQARSLLRQWRPWRLLAALAGGPLDGPVRGLALALEPEGSATADPLLHLEARLELGATPRGGSHGRA